MNLKVIKSLSISWLLVAMFFTTSFSQQYSRLKGVILNAESNEPVPFATVAFQDRSFGVISNKDGSFALPISISDSIKQIEISCIGFKSITFGLQSIGSDKIQTFKLTPISYNIDEVEVKTKKQRGKSASEIVSQAVRSISANYPNFPFLLDGYYRDYLKIDDNYLNLYEAIVQIQDNGFNTVEKEQTRIGLSYGSINTSFPIDSNMITNYGNHKIVPYGQTGYTGGNELYFLLVHNPIRNYLNESFAFIKRIQQEFLDDHRFTLLGTEYIDSVLCYNIEINYTKSEHPEYATGSVSGGSKRFRENYKAVGNIYIQADNYRIHNLSYQVFYRTLRLWELNVSYKDLAGVFYLNYLSFNNLVETPNYLDEQYFYLKNISIDKNTKKVNLFFNNPVDSESVNKHRKFRLRFDGNRIKISNIEVADTCVTLSIEDFDRSLGSFELKYSDRLNVEVRGIRDTHGNKINDLQTTRAYQYREFFVNNASADFEPIPKDLLLDRDVSIILMDNSNRVLPDSVKFNSPLIGID
jgi:hypothetical protein